MGGNGLPALTDRNFHRVLDPGSGEALVVVTTPFCGTCRRLKRVLLEWTVARDAPPIYEVDADEGPGLIADLEIFHLPSLWLWIDGEPRAELQSAPHLSDLRKALETARQVPPATDC